MNSTFKSHNSQPVHGGRVFEAARELGCHWSEIIDFSANINPLGQPEGLKEALFRNFDETLHYPDIWADNLTAAIASRVGLPTERLLPGAGSTPQLYLLARSLGLTNPAIIGPAFAEYESALNAAGLKPFYVLTQEKDDWLLTEETVKRLWAQKPDAVFLAHPANPTGQLCPFDRLAELAEEADSRQVWLIVDEAFIDFTCGGQSIITLTEKCSRLIVLRSLTKIFALPGLRLAFLAGHRQTIKTLRQLLEPWSLSSPAITAGLYCLGVPDLALKTAQTVKKLRDHLRQGLEELNLGKIFPADANFLLLRLNDPQSAGSLLENLFQKGILLRDASNFKGLETGFLRLAVRPINEIEALLSALKTWGAPPEKSAVTHA